jgi:transposase
MREWLPPEHPVWLVITAIEDHMDTGALHGGRRTGGAGAAGYDPDMLLMVLVWGYAHQVTSSRRLEELCRTDVAFRVICGGNLPDHVTIARFRSAFPGAVGELFAQVLALCARLGMGQLGVVALDGTKIAASASKAANRAEGTLAKMAAETVAAHGRAGQAEDALFGEGTRGDEVPPGAWRPGCRAERIAAALASLRAERQAAERAGAARADAFRARQRAGEVTGRAPQAAAVALAEEKLTRAREARAAQLAARDERRAAGQPQRGRAAGVEDYCRVRQAAAKVEQARAREAAARARAAERAAARKGPGPVRNITGPGARLMPVRGGGFIEGYNAQNVTGADGLIIATELTSDTTGMAWFEPMLSAAGDAARLITAQQQPRGAPAGQGPATLIGLFLTDAGYCSEHNLTVPGPDRLIATGKHRDLEKTARGDGGGRNRAGPATRAMAGRLKTDDGIAAYRQRGHIAETPHGHIKHNMRFRQVTLRGKPKAAAEWTFACTVHNLFKAITTGRLTATALETLASQPR